MCFDPSLTIKWTGHAGGLNGRRTIWDPELRIPPDEAADSSIALATGEMSTDDVVPVDRLAHQIRAQGRAEGTAVIDADSVGKGR